MQSLRREHGRLIQLGLSEEAKIVDTLRRVVGEEADTRACVWRTATLMTAWDSDGDGVLGEEERAAYDAHVDHLATLALKVGHQRRWFLAIEDRVVGPVRLSMFLEGEPAPSALVCVDDGKGWVELGEVIRAAS